MLMKLMKLAGWVLAVLLLLLVAVYLVVLGINWNDQLPSTTSIEFQSSYDSRTQIADSENAYIYLMGFDVPEEEDPFEWGVKRIAWTHDEDREGFSLPGPIVNITALRSKAESDLAQACVFPTFDCLQALENEGSLFEQWYQAEYWITDRYIKFTAKEGWYEFGKVDVDSLPNYVPILHAQRLYLMNLWWQVNDCRKHSYEEMLGRDLRFWRMVLQEKNSLLTKMIAVAAIKNNLHWANEIFSRLSVQELIPTLPSALTDAMTETELSLYNVLVGEWLFVKGYYDGDEGKNRKLSEMYVSESSADIFFVFLFIPFLKSQNTLNRHAEILRTTLAKFDKPLNYYPNIVARRDSNAQLSGYGQYILDPYNIPGRLMMDLHHGIYDNYFLRVSDLEGMRRVLMLITQMRNAKIFPEDAESFIAQSSIRNPYTDEPFEWDDAAEALVFTGLEPGERGRHMFAY